MRRVLVDSGRVLSGFDRRRAARDCHGGATAMKDAGSSAGVRKPGGGAAAAQPDVDGAGNGGRSDGPLAGLSGVGRDQDGDVRDGERFLARDGGDLESNLNDGAPNRYDFAGKRAPGLGDLIRGFGA